MTWREVTATLILLARESGLPISVECWNYRTAVRRQGAGLCFAWLDTDPRGVVLHIRLHKRRATTKLIASEGVEMLPYDPFEGTYQLVLAGRISLPLFRLIAKLLEMGFHEGV